MSVVFGLLKMSFRIPEKERDSYHFQFGKAIRPKVFRKWIKKP